MLSKPRKIACIVAAIFYVVAGILHFLHPGSYVKIVPPFIPRALAMVFISGLAEIAGGIGLLIPQLRRTAAWGLIILLVAVFPANIYMAVHKVQLTSNPLPALLLWGRLPLQFLFIWWLLFVQNEPGRTKRTDQT